MVLSIVSVWITWLAREARTRPLATRGCPRRVCFVAAHSAHQPRLRIPFAVNPSIPWFPPSLKACRRRWAGRCPIRLWKVIAGSSDGLST